MASPRITQTMRQKIVENAIKHTFKKDYDALDKRERELADRAYKEKYSTDVIKSMKKLGTDYINTSNQICVNLGGERHYYEFGIGMKEQEHRLCDKDESSYRGKAFVPSSQYRSDAEDYNIARRDLNLKAREAEVQLSAMLESVVSFKKLRAVWPQGEQFYDMYDVDSETKAGVPAVVVTEINKLLGL